MGGTNKLLETFEGKPLVRHAVEAALAAGLAPVVVVTGNQDAQIRSALHGLDVTFAHNPDFAEGLSTSLRKGVAALGGEAEAAVVLLGDMPLVEASLVRRLVAAFESHSDAPAVVPTLAGEWGNPVLLARSLFGDVAALSGDAGARKLLATRRDSVVEVPVADESVTFDVDTPELLAQLRSGGVRRAQD
nr:nucleotidyltransferase family protein [Alsobacter ponti]